MKELKDRLRDSMIERKISASELSRLSGVGKSDISNYVNGKYVPKQEKCYMLAKALGVDPGWLMTGVEQKTEEESHNEIKIVSAMMETMPVEQQEQIVAIVRALMLQQQKKGEKQ